jgi:hypothetical protein
MGDDLIPSTTPKEGGDEKATANAASNEHGTKPKNQFNPKPRGTRKNHRLSKAQWAEFLSLSSVIFWASSDLIVCHDIKRICLLVVALFVGYAASGYFLNKLFKGLRWVLVILIGLGLLTSGIAYKNSRPIPLSPAEPKVTLETLGVVGKWRPPELPKDCQMVFVRLGGSRFGASVNLLPTFPDATNNNSLMHVIGFGHAGSPIIPYIKDNRFYIAVKNLLRTNLDTVFMNEDLDYSLPPQWDRNYSSEAFEIVAEDGLPVLQIAYLRPDMIQVNGIFFVRENYGIIAFGSGFSSRPFPIDKNDVFFSQRKTWFKYPSKDHLGQWATK